MMVRDRITTRQELLDYAIGRYNFYRKIRDTEHSDHITKFYLNDFMKDLLLIQGYANSKEDDNESDTG